MPVLVILIVLSLSFYLVYKVKYVRSRRPVERKWISSKSSIALGLFVALFGVNQFFLNGNTVTYIVAIIFILIGGFSMFAGFKAYKHYLPLAAKEAQES
ncbi:YtpI family protein [Cytobacillus sp. FJAT-53684]|uniref:YtpI family protein n=1 Tax=Cytobacillus mangrovibacter TaxID=3299024 RepID=A0ABW6K269_9BACI